MVGDQIFFMDHQLTESDDDGWKTVHIQACLGYMQNELERDIFDGLLVYSKNNENY